MVDHHHSGGSTLRRRFLCPGSMALEKEAKERGLLVDSEVADEGTDLHTRLPPGVSLEDLHNEQRWAVLEARKHAADKLAGAEAIFYERPVVVALPKTGSVINWTIPDVTGVFPHERVLLEYKFGRLTLFNNTVTAQMKNAAAGELQAPGVERVKAYVYQPRTGQEFTGAFSQDDEPWKEVKETLIYAEAHPEEYHPSLEACLYCSGQSICPAFKKEVLEAPLVPETANGELTPEQFSRGSELVQLLESWARTFKALRRLHVEAGGEIPGWETKERTTRKVTDIDKAFKKVAGIMGQEDFLRCATLKLGELENLYAECRTDIPKYKAKEELKILLEDCVSHGSQTVFVRKED